MRNRNIVPIGAKIKVGDILFTDWWGPPSKVEVIDRKESDGCETGVLVKVKTLQGKAMHDAWYDASWFGTLK